MPDKDKQAVRELARRQIDAYLDGELSPEQVARLEARCEEDAELAEELALSLAIRDEFRAMQAPLCPPEVMSGVMLEVRRDLRKSFWPRLKAALAEGFERRLQPALVMAALLLIVLTSVVVSRPEPAGPDTRVADTGVEQALDDVKWTLAYVSDVGRQTGRTVRTDVIQSHVLNPLGRSVNDALDNE